jgi:hypothetical protein
MNSSTLAESRDAGYSHPQDRVHKRWLDALRAHQSGLPQPVAVAMVDAAAKGFLGEQLRKIEDALMSLENASLDDLTGSEARVLIAILQQMHGELTELERKLKDRKSVV